MSFSGSLNMYVTKIKKFRKESPYLHGDVLDTVETKFRHFSGEKRMLFDIKDAAICNDPYIEIIICPLDKKGHPRRETKKRDGKHEKRARISGGKRNGKTPYDERRRDTHAQREHNKN